MKLGQPIKPPEEESDRDLVERFQGGDMAAFEALYYCHFDYVRRLAWKWLWDRRPEDVEDAVQGVFVIVCKELPSFKFKAELTTWLGSITLNVVRNINRKRAKERGLFCPLPDTVEELQELLGELGVSQFVDTIEEAESEDAIRKAVDAIRRAIDSLSDIQKEVIYLRIRGLSYKEVASILADNENTVRSRLRDARQSLKRRLGYEREARQSLTKRLGYFVGRHPQPNAARRQAKMPEGTPAFKGRNVSLEQYVQMPEEEKFRLQKEVQEKNLEWLRWKFSTLPGASWIMVVDGQVIEQGKPKDFPSDEQLLAIIRSKAEGKYPFCFGSPHESAIEESGASWHQTAYHSTNYPDYYPALAVYVGQTQVETAVELKADFDTGAPDAYCDLDWLQQHGIAQQLSFAITGSSRHLDSDYTYYRRRLCFKLVDESGTSRFVERHALCIRNWKKSPFVEVNPNRIALLGRGMLLELKPIVHLNFDRLETKVSFPDRHVSNTSPAMEVANDATKL